MADSVVGNLIVNLKANTADLEKGLSTAQSKMKNIGSSLTSAGKSLTAGVTLPLVGIGVGATKASTDFNSAMANIGTLIPGQTERLNELKSTIQDLSVEYGKSTGDLAMGTYQVISAFGDTSETVDLLSVAVKSATAGMATTEEAVALMSAVTKGYGDTSVEANQKAMDLAFTTVKLGQTTFPELAGAMGKVIPISNALHVSQEELFASYATLTGVTGTAAEVTTQLRAAMTAMMKPSSEMAAAIEKSGYASGQAMIDELGLVESLKLVMSAAEGNMEVMTRMMGRVEAMPAVLALTGDSYDIFAEKLEAMGGASGAADDAFAQITDGANATGFAMAQLKQRIVVTFQRIGDAIAPALISAMKMAEPIISFIEKMAKAFQNAPPFVQKLIVAFAALVAALGPVLMMVGMLLTALAPLAPAIGIILGGGGIAGLVAAFPLLGTVIGIVLGPIGIAIGLIIALGAAFVIAYKKSDKFKNAVNKVAGTIKAKFQEMYEKVKPYLELIWQKAQEVFDLIKMYVPLALSYLWSVVQPILESLRALFEAVWSRIQQLTEIVWPIVQEVVIAVLSAIQSFWAEHGERILSIATVVWNTVKTVIESAAKIIQGIVQFLTAFIKGDWEGMKSAVETITSALKVAVEAIFNALKVIGQAAWDAMVSAATSAWNRLKSIASSIGSGIVSALASLPSTLYNIGANAVRGLLNGLKSLAGDIASTATDIASSIAGKIGGFLGISSPSRVLMKLGIYTMEGFNIGLQKEAGRIPGIAKSIGQATTWGIQKETKISPVGKSASASQTSTVEVQNVFNVTGVADKASIWKMIEEARHATDIKLRAKGVNVDWVKL